MEIHIAGLRWRMSFRDELAGSLLRTRYGAYAAAPASPPLRTLALTARTGTLAPDAKQGDADVKMQRTGARFVLDRLDFHASLDLQTGEADLAFVGLGGVQSFLRVACALSLAQSGGILMHSSSVVRHGRAWLFVGESGAGKTTVCRLSAPSLILSDEVSAILPSDDGGYVCHATPFWGDLADDVDASGRPVKPHEEPASAPLARVLFPCKDARDYLAPVTSLQAFRVLLREVFVFGDEDDISGAIAATCGRIAERVPAADLHFRKTPEFWSLLAP